MCRSESRIQRQRAPNGVLEDLSLARSYRRCGKEHLNRRIPLPEPGGAFQSLDTSVLVSQLAPEVGHRRQEIKMPGTLDRRRLQLLQRCLRRSAIHRHLRPLNEALCRFGQLETFLLNGNLNDSDRGAVQESNGVLPSGWQLGIAPGIGGLQEETRDSRWCCQGPLHRGGEHFRGDVLDAMRP